MYIRWKRQRRRPKWAGRGSVIDTPGKATILGAEGVVTLACQLVESRRDAASRQPRQHIIAHLASIPEYAIKDDWARAAFWDTFFLKLLRVPLSREQMEGLIHAAAAKVPFETRQASGKHRSLSGERSKSVYQMWTGDGGFKTVVRSRPRARPRQHSQPDHT